MPNALLPETWSCAGGLWVEPRLARLGALHGVTTRPQGNMKCPGARRRALEAAGLTGEPLILHQVHGTEILEGFAGAGSPAPRADAEAARGTAREEPRSPGKRVTGDGWITDRAGLVPAVYIADCLPIFVWDEQAAAAGVFHAGWRGLAAGMPGAAVRAFDRYGILPRRLAAAVGPHIGPCCYNVGEEVQARFDAAVIQEGRLDLGAEARRQLVEAGVASARISVSSACTFCSPAEFYSYRRERLDQRMLAFFSLPERGHGA